MRGCGMWTNPQRKAVHAVSHTRIPQCHKVKEDEQLCHSTGVRCYRGGYGHFKS